MAVFPGKLQAQVLVTDSIAAPDSVRSGKGAIKDQANATDSTAILLSNDGKELLTVTGDTTKVLPAQAKPSHAFRLHLSPKKDFYDPKVAVRRSAIIPGWGQVYNNRLWKVPLVYGGFAAFIVLAIQNNKGYAEYDAAVKCKGDSTCLNSNADPFPGRTIDNVISVREDYRRLRDLSFILCGLWYAINLVDAYVDAHLRGFNVSDDLTLDLNPKIGLDPFGRKSMYLGASFTLRLRQ